VFEAQAEDGIGRKRQITVLEAQAEDSVGSTNRRQGEKRKWNTRSEAQAEDNKQLRHLRRLIKKSTSAKSHDIEKSI